MRKKERDMPRTRCHAAASQRHEAVKLRYTEGKKGKKPTGKTD